MSEESTTYNPLAKVKEKAKLATEREAILKRLVSDITPQRHLESTARGNWEYRFSFEFSKWKIPVSRKEYSKLDLWDFVQLDTGLVAVVVDKWTEPSSGFLWALTGASVCFIKVAFADEVILK